MGTKGTQGAGGVKGTQGAQGLQGAQGAIGARGAQGIAGDRGNSSNTGAGGAAGDNGFAGALGTAGTRGTQGTRGIAGTRGTQGAQGAQGVQGARGAQGAQGTYGTVGIEVAGEFGSIGTGQSGTNYWVTVTGIQGNDGAEGYGYKANIERPNFTESQWNTYGVPGHVESWANTSDIRNGCRVGDLFTITGIATDTNNAHVLTYRSTTNINNLHGSCIYHAISYRGLQGAQGTDGRQGASGAPGAQGTAGRDGASGAQGTQGTRGASGAPGAQGTRGTQGYAGKTGAQGIQGPAGISTGGGGTVVNTGWFDYTSPIAGIVKPTMTTYNSYSWMNNNGGLHAPNPTAFFLPDQTGRTASNWYGFPVITSQTGQLIVAIPASLLTSAVINNMLTVDHWTQHKPQLSSITVGEEKA